jgi:hypothetical protein
MYLQIEIRIFEATAHHLHYSCGTSQTPSFCCTSMPDTPYTPVLDACRASDYLREILFGSSTESQHIPDMYRDTLIRALKEHKIEQAFFILDLDVLVIDEDDDYTLAKRTAGTLQRMKELGMEVLAYGKTKTFPKQKKIFTHYFQVKSPEEKLRKIQGAYGKYRNSGRHVVLLGAEELVDHFIAGGGENDCFLPVYMDSDEQRTHSNEVTSLADDALIVVLMFRSMYVNIA